MFKGKTFRKYMTFTKVVSKDGFKPSTRQIALRTLSRIIPLDPLSFIGSKSTGRQDSISKTIVVDEEW
jgi:uncharacterized RDD family membrane protein YckC